MIAQRKESYYAAYDAAKKPLDWGGANDEQQARIIEQLADVYIELEKYPINLTGSLHLPSGVGGFAQLPCFESPEKGLGPFETLETAYTAIINQKMRTIANHEICSLPVDNYLSFMWRLRTLPDLVSSSTSGVGPFYLKHYDDKGDHILTDNEYNITGIIDWEFASAEAKEMAFSSPCMMWPVGKYFDGDNALSRHELCFASVFDRRGRGDLAGIVRGGRRWQRCLFFLGVGIPGDMAEFAKEDAQDQALIVEQQAAALREKN